MGFDDRFRWSQAAIALALSIALSHTILYSCCNKASASPSSFLSAQTLSSSPYSTLVLLPVVSLLSVVFYVLLGKLLFVVEFLFPPGHLDKASPKNGGELVAEVLKAHGVPFIFTLVGGHISPILVESEKRGIRVIDCRHEVTTVFAADAVARLTGVAGVAAVTAGPGLTNTVTAVKNAQMAESPVILIGGAAATILKGRGALQDIDQMSLFKPICKWTATVDNVRDISKVMRMAFKKAQEGTPGPVFVEFPIDVLYPIKDVLKAYDEPVPGEVSNKPRKTKGLVGNIVQFYLRSHCKYMFSGAWENHVFTPLPYNIPLFTSTQVQTAVELLSKAKKPLILLGSQATLPPVKADDLRTAVESLNIPCFLGGMCRGLLGVDAKLQIRQQRGAALKEADVVVLAGIVADFRLDYGRSLGKKAKIIAINRDKIQLYKNSDMFWKATLGVQSDVGSFMVELSKAMKNVPTNMDSQWIADLQKRSADREKIINDTAEAKTDYMNPLKLLQAAEKILPDNCILVADGGDFVGSASYIVKPRGPLKWLDPGAFGTLGVGGGFALGAKLARPDLPVVVLYGDGSLGYSVAEYDTFTRHKVPVFSLVGNDACWTQIAREQVPMFGTDVACKLAHTDYHIVADGYGGKGFVLKEENKIQEVMEAAFESYRQGNSVLVNAFIGKTNFRDGSISV